MTHPTLDCDELPPPPHALRTAGISRCQFCGLFSWQRLAGWHEQVQCEHGPRRRAEDFRKLDRKEKEELLRASNAAQYEQAARSEGRTADTQGSQARAVSSPSLTLESNDEGDGSTPVMSGLSVGEANDPFNIGASQTSVAGGPGATWSLH